MSHAREQIRDAVVTAVIGLGLTGSRVFPSRLHPLAENDLPALLVYTGDEDVEVHSMDRPVTLIRTLDVTVEGRADDASATVLETKLDTIAAQVESALGVSDGGAPLGGLVLDIQLTRVEPEHDGEADRPLGAMHLTYAVQYRTAENDAEIII